MRTTKRFTPLVLDRFEREDRGLGIHENYKPWHRVGRGDPSSNGRSHLIPWRSRQSEFLSDLERDAFVFLTMIGDSVIDVREQFPLEVNGGKHELTQYTQISSSSTTYAGTLALSKALQIKHPIIYGAGRSRNWILSTDLLATLKDASGRPYLLAISCKYACDLLSKRKQQLLSLEREYWLVRGVEWLLVTDELFDQAVALANRRAAEWYFSEPTPDIYQHKAVELVREHLGCSFTHVITLLSLQLGSTYLAQCAYWQAVHSGQLPIDLRQGWRPHLPPTLLSREGFRELNPIDSRRTSWK